MRMSYSTRVRLAVPALAATALIVVSGCSDDGGHDMDSMTSHSMPDSATAAPSTADDSAEFNDADVAFASDMYPHHAQAVEMARLVTGRSSNPDIVSLAGAIAAAQAPEMDQLSRWLQAWGQPTPTSAPPADMTGTDHGSHGMSGMMSDQDMADLTSKTGTEFDQAWVAMMIEHHAGAIDMARTELAKGTNPDAKAMAENIIRTQQSEITAMRALQTK